MTCDHHHNELYNFKSDHKEIEQIFISQKGYCNPEIKKGMTGKGSHDVKKSLNVRICH